jgi:hypothetical protein
VFRAQVLLLLDLLERETVERVYGSLAVASGNCAEQAEKSRILFARYSLRALLMACPHRAATQARLVNSPAEAPAGALFFGNLQVTSSDLRNDGSGDHHIDHLADEAVCAAELY